MFRRRLGHFLFHTYFPTIIVVIVSWFSFWMKPQEVMERVMLGVTSLLTIFAQHAISNQSLPPVSYLKVRERRKHQARPNETLLWSS